MPDKPIDTKKVEKPETVTVPAEQWKLMLETIESLKKNEEMLIATADVGRVANFRARNQKYLGKVCRLHYMVNSENGEKVLVNGWKRKEDIVEKHPQSNARIVRQILDVFTEDDKIHEFSDSQFADLPFVTADVIQESITESVRGTSRILKLKVLGRELDIDVSFVN